MDLNAVTPSSHNLVWPWVVFHQWIELKYDVYSKKKLDVLECPEMRKILLAFFNFTWILSIDPVLHQHYDEYISGDKPRSRRGTCTCKFRPRICKMTKMPRSHYQWCNEQISRLKMKAEALVTVKRKIWKCYDFIMKLYSNPLLHINLLLVNMAEDGSASVLPDTVITVKV
jgi:hypothetical protein